MRRHFLRAVLALFPLTLAACGKPDLDLSLSDDKSSILDTRLIGIWEVTPQNGQSVHGCFLVGKKQGSQNTLELTLVGLEDDLSVSSHRLDLFACRGKHDYLSIISDPPQQSAFLPQWLLARYEVPANDTVHVHLFKYDAFRALVRREVFRGNLRGTIEGRRRRGNWVFSLPGHEPQKVIVTGSKESLIRLLDAHAEECFEAAPLVFKRLDIGGKLAVPPPPKRAPAAAVATTPTGSPQKLNAKPAAHDDWPPELPRSFEVAARFYRPGQYEVGKFEAFRSVALRVPWAYVLDRTGTLCVFRIDPNRREQPVPDPPTIPGRHVDATQPANTLEHAGDGFDLKILGNVLICTDSGGLVVYNLDVPEKPQRLGRFGPTQKRFCNMCIVPHDNVAFVVGERMIHSYDLARPNHPTHLGTLETKEFALAGCAAGHLLYAACIGKRNGILTFDVSNPARPIEVSFVPVPQTGYGLFTTPDRRLIASLDSGEGWQMTSPSYITVYGHSALYGLTEPEHPKLLKTYGQSGGRTSAFLCVGGRCFLVCQGVVFAVTKEGLEPDSVYFPVGSTLDGLPYHGGADGNYAALAADESVIVLRYTGGK